MTYTDTLKPTALDTGESLPGVGEAVRTYYGIVFVQKQGGVRMYFRDTVRAFDGRLTFQQIQGEAVKFAAEVMAPATV